MYVYLFCVCVLLPVYIYKYIYIMYIYIIYIYIYKYISVLESSARFARVLDAGPWWALPWALGPPLSCPLGCGPSSGLSPGPSPGGSPGPFAGLWRGPAGIGRSQGPIKYVKTPNDIEYVKLDQFLQSKLIFSGYVGIDDSGLSLENLKCATMMALMTVRYRHSEMAMMMAKSIPEIRTAGRIEPSLRARFRAAKKSII